MDMQALLFVKLSESRAFQTDQEAEDDFYKRFDEVPWLIRTMWTATLAVITWACVIFSRRKPLKTQKATLG